MMFFLLFSFLFLPVAAQEKKLSQHAEQVLNLSHYTLPAPSIIGKREWKELQLDRLVTILDRSTTSFGRWGLVKLLQPIADEKELSRRKEIITFLVEHEQEMRVFQDQLARVKHVEKSLLAYWDTRDQLSKSAQQFYYEARGLKDLNKSSFALNSGVVMEMFDSVKYLMIVLALGGLSAELQRWVFSENSELDIVGGLAAGLTTPYRHHSLSHTGAIDPSKITYNYKDYMRAFGYGSLADRYTVLNKGYATPEAPFWFFKKLLFTVPSMNLRSGMLGSALGAVFPTLVFDYQWGNSIVSVSKRIISMYRTLNELQQRVADVAQCVDAIQILQDIVSKQAPTLRSYFDQSDDYDDERELLIKKLLTPRFLKKSDHLYSRGHVLTMHLEMTQKKKTLIPLLHSVALLDAYCSIAQLYKESQKERVIFSFAEFVDAEKPVLNYGDAWLPLLPFSQAITNDFVFGIHNNPSKIIITGPNGGGKSTILKALGVGAVLAQSWGIVPAQEGQQTLFSAIKTNLAADEDLEQNLSKGMAGIKMMDELRQDIYKSGRNPMLVLIDEPYGGMVDVEAATRIYKFGIDIADYSHVMIAIATHTKKPIQLAQALPAIFGNYQIKINETKLGGFERLFKLEPGAAMWWFNDSDKRSRFVDWISTKGNSN